MKEIRKLWILSLFFVLAFSACTEKKQFSKQLWDYEYDTFFPERELIVDDLIQNHLHKGLCLDSIKHMLGTPVRLHNYSSDYKIYYEISSEDYSASRTRYLEVKLDDLQCFVEASIRTIP